MAYGTLKADQVTTSTKTVAFDNLAVSGQIVNADIDASAAIADTKLATISTAGKVSSTALPLASQVQALAGSDNTVLMTPLRVAEVIDKEVGSFSSKTTTYTAVSGDRIMADSSGGAFTITLPATPSLGDFVQILDKAGTFNTNNVTVGRNGSNIVGAAANLVLNVQYAVVLLIYSGNATVGWLVK